MKHLFTFIACGMMALSFTGCKTTGSGSARQVLNPEPQAVDGIPAGYKRGNPVRNAFNTFRR